MSPFAVIAFAGVIIAGLVWMCCAVGAAADDHDAQSFEPTPEMLRSVSQAEAEARGWV